VRHSATGMDYGDIANWIDDQSDGLETAGESRAEAAGEVGGLATEVGYSDVPIWTDSDSDYSDNNGELVAVT
jgi:hypothetical protein